MSDINDVRERLRRACIAGMDAEYLDDVSGLMADHARLQKDAERLNWLEGFVRKAYVYGASFDYAKSCEGEPGGFRFMTRHRLDARKSTLRASIDEAMPEQQNE